MQIMPSVYVTHLLTTEIENENYGGFIRVWRKQVLTWSTETIVLLYNEALEAMNERPVSVRWWQRMGKNNTVPVDEKRRRIIQTLLGIPVAWLALPALSSSLLCSDPDGSSSLHGHAIDIDEHIQRLSLLWRSTKKKETIPEMVSRIQVLQHGLLYGFPQQKKQVARILCQYLIAAGNAHRYQGYFSTGIEYLEKAVALAHEKQQRDLYVQAIYLRGFTHFNQWTTHMKLEDPLLASALQDFQCAEHLVATHPLNPALVTAIFSDSGRAHSYHVQDAQDRIAALKRIERGEKSVQLIEPSHSEQFLRIDMNWVDIDHAEMLLALGWYKPALEVLEQIAHGDLEARQRYLYTNILEAQANIGKGWTDIGLMYVEDAIQALGETTSRRHFARINDICGQLKATYPHSPEVARLEVKLLHIQCPAIF